MSETSDLERHSTLVAFRRGLDSSTDPANSQATQEGIAQTTLRSRWLHSDCPVCGHTFRPEDRVELKADGSVYHCSEALPCAGGDTGAQATGEVGADGLAGFFAGLAEAWPLPTDVPAVRLEPGHELLAAPLRAYRRRRCLVCAHSFRAYEVVVICPCSPLDPACALAVHRDPVRGLTCWEAWAPSGHLHHCPRTLQKLA
jgi:hypothetical protein